MNMILILVGTVLLSYVVYLISGPGIAVIAGVGIFCLMIVIYRWFSQLNKNMQISHNILRDGIVQLGKKIK